MVVKSFVPISVRHPSSPGVRVLQPLSLFKATYAGSKNTFLSEESMYMQEPVNFIPKGDEPHLQSPGSDYKSQETPQPRRVPVIFPELFWIAEIKVPFTAHCRLVCF